MSDGRQEAPRDLPDWLTPARRISLNDSANVFVGAVLVGSTAYQAAWCLAVRASGDFPNGSGLGALITLFVFAAGVVFLAQGAADVFAAKNNSE